MSVGKCMCEPVGSLSSCQEPSSNFYSFLTKVSSINESSQRCADMTSLLGKHLLFTLQGWNYRWTGTPTAIDRALGM